MVITLRPDARRPHGLPAICAGNASQPAADMVQVALVVIGCELDVAAKIDALVSLWTEPGGGTHPGLPTVPRNGRELDRPATLVGEFDIGCELRAPFPQSPDFKVLRQRLARLEPVTEKDVAGSFQR